MRDVKTLVALAMMMLMVCGAKANDAADSKKNLCRRE